MHSAQFMYKHIEEVLKRVPSYPEKRLMLFKLLPNALKTKTP